MRKICLILCLSLFISLIHAAAMTTALPSHSLNDHVIATDSSTHHCDEEANKPSDTTTKHPCDASSYQCCLGLTLAPSLELQLSTNLSEALTSTHSPLAPKTMVNVIYRPPKA
jgi:hypothetical protein